MKPLVLERRPTFFWHGLLILLPVLVLVAVGFFSLRQDKLLAQHEAADRAQTIADELASKLWSALTRAESSPPFQHHAFEVDSEGRLLFPPPYSTAPSPNLLDLSSLTSNQTLLWLKAQHAEAEGQDASAALQANRDFVDANPPKTFTAAALYAQGLLLLKHAEPQAAADSFTRLLEYYPEAVGESGVQLRPLAELKLLETQRGTNLLSRYSVSVDSVCSNAVCYPTPLAFQILDRISREPRSRDERKTVDEWRRRWQEQEASRALFSALGRRLVERGQGKLLFSAASRGADEEKAAPAEAILGAGHVSASNPPPLALFWFRPPLRWNQGESTNTNDSTGSRSSMPLSEREDQEWLAFEIPGGSSNQWFVCRAENEILGRLAGIVTETVRLPDYFSVGLELAGKQLDPLQRRWPVFDLRVWREVDYFGRNGGGEKKEYSNELATKILASAAKREGGLERLKVNILLTSSTALFKAQRARTFWFGLFVAASAGAAFIGLLTAYRAFHRQLHLAELKSNFVSSVSHELRAPIASVRLMAENLELGRITDVPRQREYFRFIVQECRRLSALIENVLDFSRIDQGRKRYEFEPTDLAALVTQTVKLMEPYAAEREVKVQLQIAPSQSRSSELQPLADGKALQQALVNLIDNAIKHSPKGETVTVGLEADAMEETKEAMSQQSRLGAQVESLRVTSGLDYSDSSVQRRTSSIRLWVEDRGDGIPPSEHERIFERFYRCGSELRRETQGVGIGLSIVKHVVEAHGGRVLVRSDIGQGSRFTIELPVISSEDAQTQRRGE